jgi:hypothetical protein
MPPPEDAVITKRPRLEASEMIPCVTSSHEDFGSSFENRLGFERILPTELNRHRLSAFLKQQQDVHRLSQQSMADGLSHHSSPPSLSPTISDGRRCEASSSRSFPVLSAQASPISNHITFPSPGSSGHDFSTDAGAAVAAHDDPGTQDATMGDPNMGDQGSPIALATNSVYRALRLDATAMPPSLPPALPPSRPPSLVQGGSGDSAAAAAWWPAWPCSAARRAVPLNASHVPEATAEFLLSTGADTALSPPDTTLYGLARPQPSLDDVVHVTPQRFGQPSPSRMQVLATAPFSSGQQSPSSPSGVWSSQWSPATQTSSPTCALAGASSMSDSTLSKGTHDAFGSGFFGSCP